MNIAEEAHVAIGKYPISMNGIAALDAVDMSNYSRLQAIIALGATNGGAITFTVEAAEDNAATGADAIPFAVYKEETANMDVLGARVACTVSGFAAVNDSITNHFYIIDVDAAALPAGHNWVNVKASGATTTTPGCAVYVLSGARYAGPESPTVLS